MRVHLTIYKKSLVTATALQLLLCSCSSDDLNWLVGTPINVVASTEAPTTRSGDNIQTSNFDSGAEMNAYYNITDGDVIGKEPIILTALAAEGGKNKLTPDLQPYYPQTGSVDIMALYPKTKATKGINSFSVKSNQVDESDYKLSDLMWAGKAGQSKQTSDVDLKFYHLMAKMTLSVTGEDGVRIEKVSLKNVVRTINITELSASQYQLGSIAEVNDANEKIIVVDSATVASATDEDLDNTLSGSVLFPPQTIGGEFIKVETNYGDTYFSITSKEFERGKVYTANLTVNRQQIGFTTAITDWSANDGSLAIPPGSSAGLQIGKIGDQEYNGKAQTPALTITYTPNDDKVDNISSEHQTYTLVACTQNEDGTFNNDGDYKAEYFNNVNQGTAMVIITGNANPSRETLLANVIANIKAMTSFEITAAKGNISYPKAEHSVPYQYNTVIKDFDLIKNGGDGQFTYKSERKDVATVSRSGVVTIKNVGTTTITANMDNSGNYTADSASYKLTITARSIKEAVEAGEMTAELVAASFPYNGSAYTPAAIVKDGGRTLQEGTKDDVRHYTYSATNNTAAGTNTAKVTITGTGNYKDAVELPFSIVQQKPKITMSKDAVIVAKGSGFTYRRHGTTTFGTVKYKSSDTKYATVDAEGVVTGIAATPANSPVTITAYVEADDSSDKGWSKADDVSYQVTVTESNWSFLYEDGQKQSWTCPKTGVYKLEAFGAQGAETNGFNGGRGAHIAGQVKIQQGQVLYIYIGQGGSEQSGSGNNYTFNGGGYYNGSTSATDAARFTAGGGATDFALMDADWDNENHLFSRILVAGGGGGALYFSSPVYCGPGGGGGAYAGEDGIGGSLPGKGGTLTAGGAVTTTDDNGNTGSGGNAGTFGKGGHYGGTTSAGCGGGGWYGGGSGQGGGRQGAGGGGSSFIYNTANINATTVTTADSYNYRTKLKTPTSGNYFDPATLEITEVTLTEGGSPDADGQARITYMGEEE